MMQSHLAYRLGLSIQPVVLLLLMMMSTCCRASTVTTTPASLPCNPATTDWLGFQADQPGNESRSVCGSGARVQLTSVDHLICLLNVLKSMSSDELRSLLQLSSFPATLTFTRTLLWPRTFTSSKGGDNNSSSCSQHAGQDTCWLLAQQLHCSVRSCVRPLTQLFSTRMTRTALLVRRVRVWDPLSWLRAGTAWPFQLRFNRRESAPGLTTGGDKCGWNTSAESHSYSMFSPTRFLPQHAADFFREDVDSAAFYRAFMLHDSSSREGESTEEEEEEEEERVEEEEEEEKQQAKTTTPAPPRTTAIDDFQLLDAELDFERFPHLCKIALETSFEKVFHLVLEPSTPLKLEQQLAAGFKKSMMELRKTTDRSNRHFQAPLSLRAMLRLREDLLLAGSRHVVRVLGQPHWTAAVNSSSRLGRAHLADRDEVRPRLVNLHRSVAVPLLLLGGLTGLGGRLLLWRARRGMDGHRLASMGGLAVAGLLTAVDQLVCVSCAALLTGLNLAEVEPGVHDWGEACQTGPALKTYLAWLLGLTVACRAVLGPYSPRPARPYHLTSRRGVGYLWWLVRADWLPVVAALLLAGLPAYFAWQLREWVEWGSGHADGLFVQAGGNSTCTRYQTRVCLPARLDQQWSVHALLWSNARRLLALHPMQFHFFLNLLLYPLGPALVCVLGGLLGLPRALVWLRGGACCGRLGRAAIAHTAASPPSSAKLLLGMDTGSVGLSPQSNAVSPPLHLLGARLMLVSALTALVIYPVMVVVPEMAVQMAALAHARVRYKDDAFALFDHVEYLENTLRVGMARDLSLLGFTLLLNCLLMLTVALTHYTRQRRRQSVTDAPVKLSLISNLAN